MQRWKQMTREIVLVTPPLLKYYRTEYSAWPEGDFVMETAVNV